MGDAEGQGGGGGEMQIRVEDLPKLPMEQLRMIKSQLDEELRTLQDSLANLRRFVQRVEAAKVAVTSISKRTPGQEVLVPLTGSLYVPGKLRETNKLIVDIGAAYYVEKSYPETQSYCDRKIVMLKENMEKVVEVLAAKEQISENLMSVMNAKMRALMGGAK